MRSVREAPAVQAAPAAADKPPLLFLAQRIPYPPDKGDKIRSWRSLKHLAGRFRVHLGCFYDTPSDAQHIAFLETVCASVCCRPLAPRRAKLRSLASFLRGEALTLGYFSDRALRRWVGETVARERPAAVFVFSSAMTPYAPRRDGATARIFDMVDVDSDKWRQYAQSRAWPMRAIYAREHRTLFAHERAAALDFDATLLVSPAERALFAAAAPETAARLRVLRNGIDAAFFDPAREFAAPFAHPERTLVFTGAMDYWPNVEAVSWFAEEVLPLVRRRRADAEFWIVGAEPDPRVRRLAERPGVTVTGRVADVRPYLRHAAAVVAPLRIARGTQNKVLEAMAMARPIVATPEANNGVDAAAGEELLVAREPAAFAAAVETALAGGAAELGRKARRRVLEDYAWNFDLLDELTGRRRAAAPAAS